MSGFDERPLISINVIFLTGGAEPRSDEISLQVATISRAGSDAYA